MVCVLEQGWNKTLQGCGPPGTEFDTPGLESCHVLSVASRSSRSVLQYPSLVSSVRDAPVVSARTAGIPKPTHLSPPVLELIPLPAAFPIWGIALWSVWAAYTTNETLEMAPATETSPEVAADAAEPPEMAALASNPCVVVAPTNALSACHVVVEGTIAELSLYPDGTTVLSKRWRHPLQNL